MEYLLTLKKIRKKKDSDLGRWYQIYGSNLTNFGIILSHFQKCWNILLWLKGKSEKMFSKFVSFYNLNTARFTPKG